MRILVSGGAGFLGRSVVARCVRAGHEVMAVDNLSHGRADAVPPPAQLIQADVRISLDETMLRFRPEVVVHLAAQVSVPDSVADPAVDEAINIGGTINVIAAAARSGARKVISISSAAVYGIPVALPLTESSPLAP